MQRYLEGEEEGSSPPHKGSGRDLNNNKRGKEDTTSRLSGRKRKKTVLPYTERRYLLSATKQQAARKTDPHSQLTQGGT